MPLFWLMPRDSLVHTRRTSILFSAQFVSQDGRTRTSLRELRRKEGAGRQAAHLLTSLG